MRVPKRVFDIRKYLGESTIAQSNLPEKYIERKLRQIDFKTPEGPQYTQVTRERKEFEFGLSRPWENEFQITNYLGRKVKINKINPFAKWPYYKGDRVQILKGDDMGKQGIVSYMVEENNWLCVEGLNLKYDLINNTKDNPGLMIASERPLTARTGVELIDPVDELPTKIVWRHTETGEEVRVSVRTGRIIPKPVMAEETVDYKKKSTYKEQDKDTKEADVLEVTYKPALKTFEMDIMELAGIEEDRIPELSYWYYAEMLRLPRYKKKRRIKTY